MKQIVEKTLSPNDIGITGSHQSGILIPKKSELLAFFPKLDINEENPRMVIRLIDLLGQVWKFNYIYYNNKLRGGTRNEYRLTGMTKYLRSVGAVVGDTLIFENNNDEYYIRVRKQNELVLDDDGVITLVLDDSWRVINF